MKNGSGMKKAKKIETFHISTYGCQMNLADSSTLTTGLITRGYRIVDDESKADLIILNTCSVRAKAEHRILGRLGEIRQYKERNPDLKVAVVGCMAQRWGRELIEKAPHVDYVLGPDRLFQLADVLEGKEGTSRVMTAFGHENMDVITPAPETSYSAFVTISRGCDNCCTYCIVPYVRGPERYHAADHIVDSVKKLVEEGVVEITLLGQNVNSYHYNQLDFPGLVNRVARETDIKRIRFMTSHPKDLSERLIDVMAGEPKMMPHVHLPLQSGCDRILDRMGRGYTLKDYRKIIDYLRHKLDYVSITTDLIVGFPSETESEYEQTLQAVREIKFDAAFMFRYSVRPHTPASQYPDDVAEIDKIHRLNKLILLQQQTGYERNQRELEQVRYSLIEGVSRRSEQFLRARTEGNKIVLFPANGSRRYGTIVPVYITAADAFTLHGQLEEHVNT